MKDYWPGMGTVINIDDNAWVSQAYDQIVKTALVEPTVVIFDETPINYLQAASFINVSLDYFKREVAAKLSSPPEDGNWGKWRCSYKDLAAYRKEEDKRRFEAMNELVALDQELGLYE